MKKLLLFIVCLSVVFNFAACAKRNTIDSGDEGQEASGTQDITDISEFPSAESEISESSETLSEIISEIESDVSSEVKSSEISSASSAPQSSKEESKPVSSEALSSEIPVVYPSEESGGKDDIPVISSGEMRAVWISYLEFQEFQGSGESAFRSKIGSMFDYIQSVGLNAVIVQVRPHGDAFYPSDYFPWSKCISGTMGEGVSYDPLEIMISAAHSRGLEFHAWVNPYRTMTDKEFSTVPDSYPLKKWYNSPSRGSYMVKMSDGRWWLKPGSAEAQKLILNGVSEIVSRYNVDGIHLDDYFYGGSLSLYGDSASQAKRNTTDMVRGIYDVVKSYDYNIRFGISPAGGFREDQTLPNSDLGYLSTDLALWCRNDGYIDYIMPQIYWEYDHSTQPFSMTLDKWQNFVTAPNVTLYVGLAPYKLSAGEIEQQMVDSLNGYKSQGYCLFRYSHIGNLTIY